MSRARLVLAVTRANGDVVSGATLVFYEWPETTPLTPLVEPIYGSATSGTQLTSLQKVTDANGRFEAWKETPERVILVSTSGGVSTQTVEEFIGDPSDITGFLFPVRAFGAQGDGVVVTDGAMVSGTTTLTSASNLWPAALNGASLVGKTVTVMNPGIATYMTSVSFTASSNAIATSLGDPWRSEDVAKRLTLSQGGPSGTPLVTSVLGFSSGAAITAAAVAQNSVSPGIEASTALVEPYFLRTTIAARNGAGSLTLNAAAPATISGATVAFGTDDTVAVQAAIDAAYAAGGGTVEFTGGVNCTFMVSGLTLRNGVHLVGDGCTIRRLPGATGTLLHTASASTPLSNVTIEHLTIENDWTADYVIQAATGSSRLTFDRVTINNIRDGVAIALFNPGAANTGDNTDIVLDHCRVVANMGKNGGTLGIPNGVRVTITDSYFYLPGSLDFQITSDSATGKSRDIKILDSHFEDGGCSLLFFGPGATNNQVAQDILVDGCEFLNCGWMFKKGILAVNNNNANGITGAITRRFKFSESLIHHWSGGNTAGDVGGAAIAFGGPPFTTEDLEISGNTLDGTYASTPRSYGVAEAADTRDNLLAILIASASRMVVTRNIIRYCGSAAIAVHGVSHGTIANNTATFTGQVEGSAFATYEAYAAIAIVSACTNIVVSNNTVSNTGSSTVNSLPWAGIGIAAGHHTVAGGDTDIVPSTHITICGNRCYDDRGVNAKQSYGVRLGFNPTQALTFAYAANPAAATQPTDCLVYGNDVAGNLVDGIYEPTFNSSFGTSEGATLQKNHTIYGNSGYTGGLGHLLFSRTLTADGTGSPGEIGDFFVPLASPFYGILHIEARTGDNLAAAFFAVSHTVASAATQAVSTAFGTCIQGTGVIPTLASLPGSEAVGAFRVNNQWAASVLVRVIQMPSPRPL